MPTFRRQIVQFAEDFLVDNISSVNLTNLSSVPQMKVACGYQPNHKKDLQKQKIGSSCNDRRPVRHGKEDLNRTTTTTTTTTTATTYCRGLKFSVNFFAC